MAIVPSTPPTSPKPTRSGRARDVELVEYDRFIEKQIHRTRQAVKLVDFAYASLQLLVAAVVVLLAITLVEHWLVPGGLHVVVRYAVFGLLVASAGYFFVRRIWPLLWSRINPVYAAHTIERGHPSLKNSLVNFLLFRTRREQMPSAVYEALKQQAAQGLARVPVDLAVDRSPLIRLGYVLVAIVVLGALYAFFSPKHPFATAGRVLAPWAAIAPPSRVHVDGIEPGTATITQGETLTVSADVRGLREGESVRLRYTTADGQEVDASAAMRPTESGLRYEVTLPPAMSQSLGIDGDLQYRIEAGDARTIDYKVTVVTAPILVVRQVHYDFPEYTGYIDQRVENLGDIRGIEGTRVTIHAEANGPIDFAELDFNSDGRTDLKMTSEGTKATASFVLAMRDDRRTPLHTNYTLRFENLEGRKNLRPAQYRIDVIPDYAPEVELTAPKEETREVQLDETVVVNVDARDPDFALNDVSLVGQSSGREIFKSPLLESRPREGRFTDQFRFTPNEHGLKPGDEVKYWATATDTRDPDANVATSTRQTFRIVDPQPKQPDLNQIAQRDPAKNQEQQGNQEGQEQQGQNGEGQAQQQPGNPGGNQGGEAPSEPGDAGGGEGQQGEQGEQGENSDSAEGGQGGADGKSQGDPKNGESGKNEPGRQGDASEENNQSNNGDQQQGDPQNSDNQQGQPGKQSGGQDKQQGQSGKQSTGEGRQQDDQQGKQSGEAEQSPVANDGSDDGSAFERIGEHLNQKNQNGESGEQRESGQQQEGGEQKEGGRQQGDPSAKQQRRDAASRDERASQEGSNESAQPGDKAQPKQGEPKTGDNEQGQSGEQSTGPSKPGDQQKPSDKPTDGERPADEQSEGDPAQQRPDASEGTGAKTQSGSPNEQEAPSQAQDGQTKSSGGEQQRPRGEAGQGADEKPQGAPDGDQPVQERQKTPGDPNEKPQGENPEPPAGSNSKKESDSRGEKGGDKAGGGEEGGGQKTPREGTGSAGQNQAADEGAGQSADKGPGESTTQPGSDAPSQQPTGEAGEKQPGEGSGQREGVGNKPGGDQADQAQGSEGAKPPSDDQGSRDAESSEQGAQPGANPDQQQPQQNGEGQQPGKQGGATGNPTTGGNTGSDAQAAARGREAEDGDKANLEFARRQTDLTLQKLSDQLRRKDVDQEMLDKLGWSEDDLAKFVERWRERQSAANRKDAEGETARQELDQALKSLGLRPAKLSGQTERERDNVRDLRDGPRAPVPLEWQEWMRAYNQGVSRGKQSNERN